MTTEEKLKEYILGRYKSIREFTQVADMSYSTFDSILRRGIDNSSVTNIIKICKVLGLSVDDLANGNITPINTFKSDPGLIEVEDILTDVKTKLLHCDGLTLEGKPIEKNSINVIVQAMNIGEEMAKHVTKK